MSLQNRVFLTRVRSQTRYGVGASRCSHPPRCAPIAPNVCERLSIHGVGGCWHQATSAVYLGARSPRSIDPAWLHHTTSTWSVMGASGHLCHPVPWRPRSCTSRAASNMSAPSRTPHRGWMPRTRGRSGAGRRGKSESTAVVEAVHLSWLAFTHRFLLCRRARTAVHRHASRRCIRSCTAAAVPRQLTTSHNHAPARVPRDRIEAIPENIITAPDSKDPLSVLGQPSLRPRVHAATVG